MAGLVKPGVAARAVVAAAIATVIELQPAIARRGDFV